MCKMKLLCLLISFSTISFSVKALQCWTCENARTAKQCKTRGRLQTCLSNQQSCQSEVRRDHGGYRITKRCKQDLACQNDLNNARCHRPKLNSACRCCCNFTGCNARGMNCQKQRIPTKKPNKDHLPHPKVCPVIEAPKFGVKDCSKVPENKIGSLCKFSCNEGYRLAGKRASKCVYRRRTNTAAFNRRPPKCKQLKCPRQTAPEHGSISCTNGPYTSSTCMFTCDEENGYQLHPPGVDTNFCQSNRKWSSLKPCCIRICPKYAKIDLIVLLDSSFSIGLDNWKIMKEFVSNLTNRFTIAPDAAQISVIRYNDDVDTTSKIFFNSVQNATDFNDAYQRIPYNGRGTNTGNALRYVRNELLQEESGNRPDVDDVLLVVTDGLSDDRFHSYAKQLRKRGVETNEDAVRSSDSGSTLRVCARANHFKDSSPFSGTWWMEYSVNLGDRACVSGSKPLYKYAKLPGLSFTRKLAQSEDKDSNQSTKRQVCCS